MKVDWNLIILMLQKCTQFELHSIMYNLHDYLLTVGFKIFCILRCKNLCVLNMGPIPHTGQLFPKQYINNLDASRLKLSSGCIRLIIV